MRPVADTAERTPPEAAVESLILWLNLQEGEELPLNRLRRQSGLAWATTSKYVALIERMQELMPKCERTEGGVRVLKASPRMEGILQNEVTACALALSLMSKGGGEMDMDLLPPQSLNGLEELEEMDGVVRTDEGLSLQPVGWTIANSAYLGIMQLENSLPERPKPSIQYVRSFPTARFKPTGQVLVEEGYFRLSADAMATMPEAAAAP